MKVKIILILTIIITSCQMDLDHSKPKWFTQSSIEDIIIPEIFISNGGIQKNPAPEGEVYYYNGSREESDIRLDDSVYNKQNVRRYIRVSGIAVPYESGFKDRFYHSVLFMAKNLKSGKLSFFSIPVDNKNRFTGYIYFDETGDYKVYSFRSQNDFLYPRYNSNFLEKRYVAENSSTLVFNVNVIERVSPQYSYLIPTRNVNSGNKYLREYATNLTKDLTNDTERVKRIFEFLVFGDTTTDNSDDFFYQTYDNIYPSYLTGISYEDIFIASHFLEIRKGVCNDFAETFAAMTRALGYKVKKISGEDSTGEAHMWNIIDLTGDENIWLRIDATWGNVFKETFYKKYAEFYPEFDGSTFDDEHKNKFSINLKEEY